MSESNHGPASVIDCDLHNELPSLSDLYPYLPDHWCDYCEESAFNGPDVNDYPAGAPTTALPGSRPAEGEKAGSDLSLLQKQALDVWQTEIGILSCAYWVQSVHNPDLAAALATALNQWQIEQWLDKEPRLRASLVVPSQVPSLAAEEIERFGSHPGMVQVILPVRAYMPYGNRNYDPLFAAAVASDLVVGIHFGGAAGLPPTPSGWPSTYIEEYMGMAQIFQSQVISLVIEGAFDRFPTLRVSLLESGFTWMPSLMWRMDKEWKGLRHNTPWVKRPPSEYMKEHIRISVQPLDAPLADRAHVQTILTSAIGQIECDDMLMFATDYPHWQFDTDADAWPLDLPDPLAAKIWRENARAWYRL